ncbi:MAG: hypothetical protein JSV51_02035 [Candidatus Bathyarchaeota archaeon]|nr:MAG: hypothetical protein JSV51_02035 [Candidatus Bathyarchaeota archaeon]
MRYQSFQLDDDVLKATDDMKLWKNEKGLVEITKDALAVGVTLDSKRCGYVFHGVGRLLIDTIVETDKGAVGSPVEKELDTPFLMLGKLDDAEKHLDAAEKKDFQKLGYDDQQQFISKGEELLDLFFENSEGEHKHSRMHIGKGFIFAFPNDSKLDILVTKGSKIVYTATDMVFVSKGDEVVLTSHGDVVVSRPGKSVFITNGHSRIR